MLKLFRLLPVLGIFSAGCPVFELPPDLDIIPRKGTMSSGDLASSPLILQPNNCALPSIKLGGGGGAPMPKLVAGPQAGVLMELSATENCLMKTGGTLAEMVCTVPPDQIPPSLDVAGFGYRIHVDGSVALPGVPTAPISGSGSIEFGTPSMPPTVSIATPVIGLASATDVNPDTVWRLSAASSDLKLSQTGLQVLFKIFISCGGGATLKNAFHWQVNTLTITPLTSSSGM